MKMTVELTQLEVEAAIKFYLEVEHGFEVKDVKIEVGNIDVGYGPMESTRPGFKHAKCTVIKEKNKRF